MKSRLILTAAAAAAVLVVTGCQDQRYVESTGDRRAIEGVKAVFGIVVEAAKNIAANPETGLSLKAEGAFRDYVEAQCAYRAYSWRGSSNYDKALRTCSEQMWQERTFAERGETPPPRGPLVDGGSPTSQTQALLTTRETAR